MGHNFLLRAYYEKIFTSSCRVENSLSNRSKYSARNYFSGAWSQPLAHWVPPVEEPHRLLRDPRRVCWKRVAEQDRGPDHPVQAAPRRRSRCPGLEHPPKTEQRLRSLVSPEDFGYRPICQSDSELWSRIGLGSSGRVTVVGLGERVVLGIHGPGLPREEKVLRWYCLQLSTVSHYFSL